MLLFLLSLLLLCIRRLRGWFYLIRGPEMIDEAYVSVGWPSFAQSYTTLNRSGRWDALQSAYPQQQPLDGDFELSHQRVDKCASSESIPSCCG